jgi:branched-subunit amino acid ABC-type transport system permease component
VEGLQALTDGVALGATYALLGLGFTLVFGVLRRLNLAYGATILVGITAGTLSHRLTGSLVAALAVTVAGAVLAGMYVERCAFRALAAQAPVVTLIASFAASMQLQELVALGVPSRTLPYPAPAWLPDLTLGAVLLRGDALLRWAGAAAILAALFALLHRTRFGLALRALADSREGALLMGIDPHTVGALAFVLASAIGGSAGALVAISQRQVTPYFGLWATVKGLTASLLGGLGSLPGAVAGGLALGVAETVTLWLAGGQWRDLVAYALLFAVVAAHGRARRADAEPAG